MVFGLGTKEKANKSGKKTSAKAASSKKSSTGKSNQSDDAAEYLKSLQDKKTKNAKKDAEDCIFC